MGFKANLLASAAIHAAVLGTVAAVGIAGSRDADEDLQIPICIEVVEAAAPDPGSSQPATEETPPGEEESQPATEEMPAEEVESPPATEEMPSEEVESPPATEEAPPEEDASPVDGDAQAAERPMPAEDATEKEGGQEPRPEDAARHDMAQESTEEPGQDESMPVAQEERARVVASPMALGRITPSYPRSARRRGHEGCVTVEVEVAEDGGIDHAEVVESSGHGELDAAALSAVRSAHFAPATENGASVRGLLRLTFNFRLE